MSVNRALMDNRRVTLLQGIAINRWKRNCSPSKSSAIAKFNKAKGLGLVIELLPQHAKGQKAGPRQWRGGEYPKAPSLPDFEFVTMAPGGLCMSRVPFLL